MALEPSTKLEYGEGVCSRILKYQVRWKIEKEGADEQLVVHWMEVSKEVGTV